MASFLCLSFSIRTAEVWICWFVSPPESVNQQSVIKDVKELLHFPVQNLTYWSISNYLAAESHVPYFSSPLWSKAEDQRQHMQKLSVLLSVSISQTHLWLFTFPLSEQGLFSQHCSSPVFFHLLVATVVLLLFPKKKRKKPDGFNAVYPRKHFEHSVIKLGGNPSLPLCLLASNHINMK